MAYTKRPFIESVELIHAKPEGSESIFAEAVELVYERDERDRFVGVTFDADAWKAHNKRIYQETLEWSNDPNEELRLTEEELDAVAAKFKVFMNSGPTGLYEWRTIIAKSRGAETLQQILDFDFTDKALYAVLKVRAVRDPQAGFNGALPKPEDSYVAYKIRYADLMTGEDRHESKLRMQGAILRDAQLTNQE